MTGPEMRRLHAAATRFNREAILAVLHRVLPDSGLVLEVASGSGEHGAHFAPRLPGLVWQPSDSEPDMLASIEAWRAEAGAPKLYAPLVLDVCAADWPVTAADAVVCINLIHVAPWDACAGLMRGAGRVLGGEGVLYLYGAYQVGGRHTAPSNAAFDRSLRAINPEWGVRHLEDVAALAGDHGLRLAETVDMPRNNLSVVFRKMR